MIRRIGTLLALGLGSLVGLAQTTSGELSGTEVWSGEVRLTGDITIPFGGDLTIQPGTKVLVETSDDIESGFDTDTIEIRIVGGTFRAVGTDNAPIEFLSAAEIPKPGHWYGILCDLGEVDIRHVQIGHAAYPVRFVRPGFYDLNETEIYDYSETAIWIEASGRYSFDEIRIRSKFGVGGYAFYNSGARVLEFTNWHISGGRRGIYVATSEALVSNSLIERGSSYGIWIDSGKLTVANTIVSGRTDGVEDRGKNTELEVRNSQFLSNSNFAVATFSVRAVVRDSQFRGNGYGVFLRGGSLSTAVDGGNRFMVHGNVFEGNQEAAILVPSTARNVNRNPISKLAKVSANAFLVNGTGFASDLSVPDGVLSGNDFVLNGVDITIGQASSLDPNLDPKIVANGNYWGEVLTAVLESGEEVSSINAFRGDIVVEDWATSSRLESVEPPPSPIEWDTNDWGVTVGETATIQLSLDNGDSYNYQWFKDGVVIQGVGAPFLEIRNATLADAGSYIVVVSNEAGTVTSQPAVLSVVAAPQNIPANGTDSFHPADTNQDLRISIDEVTSYGAAWKNGRDWTHGPNPIPIDYLTRAGAIWKNGERYRKDGNIDAAPLWWVNDSGAGKSRAGRGVVPQGGNIVRSSVRTELPQFQRIVSDDESESQLLVTPPAGVGAWAIEGHGLREGPFLNDQSRRFSLPFGQTDGGVLLSIDGESMVFGWAPQRDTERLEVVRVNGRFGLKPVGLKGLFQVEGSHDLVEWSTASLGRTQDGVLFPRGMEGKASSYYRLSFVGE